MGKKWLRASIFVLITALGLYFGGICLGKEMVVGLLLDGYQKNCTVERKGKVLEAVKGMELYAGDVITKKPDIKKLKILYFPYASGVDDKNDKTKLSITFKPPQPEYFEKVRELLGFEMERQIKEASSRGFMCYNSLKIRGDLFQYGPFPGATLLAGEEIRFYTEDGDGEQLVIYDTGKKELGKVNVDGAGKVKLEANGLKLEPGKTYYWRLGSSCPYIEFRVLDAEMEQEVRGVLGQIAKEEKNEIDIILKRAVYLKAISEAYPERADLFWWSYELLREMALSQERVSQNDVEKMEFFLMEIYAAKIGFARE